MAPAGSGRSAAPRGGPLHWLVSLLSTAALIVALSFAWLLGSQAVRRAQQAGAGATVATVLPSAGAGVGSNQVRSISCCLSFLAWLLDLQPAGRP